MMTLNEVDIALIEKNQSFSKIRGQVARILLEHAQYTNDGQNRLTQRDIATMLHTEWYMVHLSLKSLYHEGIIRIERNRITLNKVLIQKAADIE